MNDNEKSRIHQEELKRIEEQRRREQKEIENRLKNQGIGSGDRPKRK